MFGKLDDVEKRYEELQLKVQDPDVISDRAQYRALMRELSDLGEVVKTYQELRKASKELAENKELLELERDEEIRRMAKDELARLQPEVEGLELKLKMLLLPKDPNDEKNIILEIRAGAGGDEASLFAEQLFRGYTHYASARGWRFEIMSISAGNVGGYRECIANISGEKVFSFLKYESGVHRVQRVPKTEAQGRVHTSTVTVAVLPEVDEVDVKIDPNDLRIDVFRAGGHGGQSVNTTDSAVRITHIPSGLVVSCQDEKSQLKNKAKGMKVLLARLRAQEVERAQKSASDARLAQIGTGDRSERIRTYNFPQSRITDHRIGLTIHQITEVMNGSFELLLEPLMAHYQTEALKQKGM